MNNIIEFKKFNENLTSEVNDLALELSIELLKSGQSQVSVLTKYDLENDQKDFENGGTSHIYFSEKDTDILVNALAKKINRSRPQEEFLFELCGKNFKKLCDLEFKIKEKFITYCPNNIEEIDEILSK